VFSKGEQLATEFLALLYSDMRLGHSAADNVCCLIEVLALSFHKCKELHALNVVCATFA
jgi:hypothetical protein